MGKIVGGILCLGIILMLMTVGCTKIPPGHVGIEVNMAGNDRGVSSYTPTTGWVFYNRWMTNVFQYPTFVQTAKWTKDLGEGHAANEEVSFSSKDGSIITGDVSLSYQLVKEKVPYFYQEFRSDDLDTFTHGFLRNVARDAFGAIASNYAVEDLYSSKRQEFTSKVKDQINSVAAKYGVQIDQFGFLGAMRLPANLVNSINLKIKANQDALRVENELKISEAEAAKTVAIAEGNSKARIAEAEGTSRAQQLLQQTVTPAIIELKRLDVQNNAIEKWNGELPTNMYGAAPVPFLNIPASK